jgi:hypothetical protein
LDLIAIDDAAFWYQPSDLKIFGRLTILRPTLFVFLDLDVSDLRSNFDDASAFATQKWYLSPRMKHLPVKPMAFCL